MSWRFDMPAFQARHCVSTLVRSSPKQLINCDLMTDLRRAIAIDLALSISMNFKRAISLSANFSHSLLEKISHSLLIQIPRLVVFVAQILKASRNMPNPSVLQPSFWRRISAVSALSMSWAQILLRDLEFARQLARRLKPALKSLTRMRI